jgi:CRP-like cAMP-binding protein
MSPIAANEFSRIALLASLPGDRLGDLASRMKRENVQPGKTVVIEGEPGERFYVVLSGMLEVTQAGRGQRTMLKPGDYFGEVALAMDMPRTASVRAVTPSTVASCDKATFDEFVRPVFAEDEPERGS